MKSKSSKGATCRADVADGVRLGREIENVETSHGYAVLLGREFDNCTGKESGVYADPEDGGECMAPFSKCLMDYERAVDLCARLLLERGETTDYPPPEFPRVVFVSVCSSVVDVPQIGVFRGLR